MPDAYGYYIKKSLVMKILIISGHDYRTSRRANLHFIAKSASKNNEVTFFSAGYSWISDLIGRDPRTKNKIVPGVEEKFDGIRCYLDRGWYHPGGLKGLIPDVLSRKLFEFHLHRTPEILWKYVKDSDVILIESGISCMYIDYVFDVKKSSNIIYIASDDLKTLGVSSFLMDQLKRNEKDMVGIRIPSRLMAKSFGDNENIFYVPHGIEFQDDPQSTSPYDPGTVNAVSVGSMLFDHTFFEYAATSFPDIAFHIIGSGSRKNFSLKNIIKYPEMNYQDTLRYIRFANIGIAPYKLANVPYYLTDTSMKLLQFEYFGIQAVCPFFATSEDKPWRHPYSPGDRRSIECAIRSVVEAKSFPINSTFLNWDDVVLRILNPELFDDTKL